MSAKGTLKIKILGDDKQFRGALDSSQAGLTAWAKKAAVAFAGLMVVKKLAGFMSDAVAAGMAEQKTMQKLADTLVRTTGATDAQIAANEAWISKMQSLNAVADNKTRPVLERLVSTTKDLSKAQEIASVAMDIAAARGLELETVALALEKAYQGNMAGLGRLGIAYKDARGNVLAFDDAMRGAAETYGGAAAKAADTFAGRVEKMRLALGDAKEAIGMAFIPLLEKMMPGVQRFVGWVGKLAANFQKVSESGGFLKGISTLLKQAITDISNWFVGGGGQQIAGALVGFIQTAWTQVMPALIKSSGAFIHAMAKALGAALAEAVNSNLQNPPLLNEPTLKVDDKFNRMVEQLRNTSREVVDLWGDATPFSGYAEAMAGYRQQMSEILQRQREDFEALAAAAEAMDTAVQGYKETLQSIYESEVSGKLGSMWEEAKGSLEEYNKLLRQKIRDWAEFGRNLKIVAQKYGGEFGADVIMAAAREMGPSGIAKLATAGEGLARGTLAGIQAVISQDFDTLGRDIFNATSPGTTKAGSDLAGKLIWGWDAHGGWPTMGTKAVDAVKDRNWYGAGYSCAVDFKRGFEAKIGAGISVGVRTTGGATRYPGYYQEGGPVRGTGPVPIVAHGGEYVLTQGDTQLMRALIAALSRGTMTKSEQTYHVTVDASRLPRPDFEGLIESIQSAARMRN